ncbi:glycerophosphodiester phosphodiesterase family protein [Rhizobium leguminosarum]|uniref:glycerophosphodiester phosphodiesterase family protein n=1 Tax=Rhizobium leguminosarum TaxID=384 RepID=UPI0013F16565|nr:hypothetical protein [Rhizobium leguminosarum]
MRIIAHRGAPLHAPENSRFSLLAAYAAGADVLAIDVRMTSDGELVLAADSDLAQLTGISTVVENSTLAQLKALNLAETFQPAGSADFHYYDPTVPSRRIQIETLVSLLDEGPDDLRLLVTLRPKEGEPKTDAARLVTAALEILRRRRATERTILAVTGQAMLNQVRAVDSSIAVVIDGLQGLKLFESGKANGIVVPTDDVLTSTGEPTAIGQRISTAFAKHNGIGAILTPGMATSLTAVAIVRLKPPDWIWGAATDAILDPGLRSGIVHIDIDFKGEKVDTSKVALGYAKANKFGKIFQKDGVHIDIAKYEGKLPSSDSEMDVVEDRLHFAIRDWPYYSGGGVGTVTGIKGDFSAETEYRVENVGQATTLEMAATNVDPGSHQATTPTSFRQKDSFYDPHGAPPFVGVEHDEDDGFRINWNFGTEYDNVQYGKPVGDGRTPRGARLRLDRRGEVFAAYYCDAVDAAGKPLSPQDWVCVGVVRNESLNKTIFLRCAGKRWLQEREDKPDEFMPILPNKFLFRWLKVVRFPR